MRDREFLVLQCELLRPRPQIHHFFLLTSTFFLHTANTSFSPLITRFFLLRSSFFLLRSYFLRGVGQGLVDVLSFKVGICSEDFVTRASGRRKSDDGTNRDAQTANAGLAAHDVGIDGDPFERFHDLSPSVFYGPRPEAGGAQSPMNMESYLILENKVYIGKRGVNALSFDTWGPAPREMGRYRHASANGS